MKNYYCLLAISCFFYMQASAETVFLDSIPEYIQADVVGDAYSLNTQELLYRELHYYSKDKGYHRVVYVDKDNNEIVNKFITYKEELSAPEFKQIDSRTDEQSIVSWQDEQIHILYKPKFEGEVKEGSIKPKYPLVIDAGFDNFVRESWDELLTGDRIAFNYVAPTRISLVNLNIVSIDCSEDILTDDKGKNDLVLDQFNCFQIKPSQWLISLFLKPIDLVYTKNERRLYRFYGLSNINDKNGKGQKVDIRYSY